MKTIEFRENYLFVEYDESTDSSTLILLMKEIAQMCRDRKYTKILADLRNTNGTPNLFQRYQLGVSGANLLRGIQIAVVYRADENNHFAESVAINRGLPTIITDDMEKAKRWLEVE